MTPANTAASGAPAGRRLVAMLVGATATAAVGGYIAAEIGYKLVVRSDSGVAVFLWPPSGLMLALLVLINRRWWVAAIGGAFLGNVALDVQVAPTFFLAAASSLVNSVEQLVTATVFLRVAGPHARFNSIRDVKGLVSAYAATGITAVAGAWVVQGYTGAALWRGWLGWWVGDGLSILVLAPFVLTLAGTLEARRRPGVVRSVEAAIVITAIALIGRWLVALDLASPPPDIANGYLMFPLVIWAAVRFGPVGAAGAALALCAATTDVLHQSTSVAMASHLPGIHSVLSAYAYASLAAVTGLVPAAALAERTVSERQLWEVIELAPVGFASIAPNGRILAVNDALVTMLGYDHKNDLVSQDVRHIFYVNPEDRDRMIDMLARTTAVLAFDTTWKRRDGAPVDVKLAKRAVVDGNQVVRHEAFVHDVSEERRAMRSEAEQRRRLQVLSAAMLRMQERERARLSRDLHDRLGQALTAAKLSLIAAARAAPDTAPDTGPDTAPGGRLAEATEILDFAIGEARRLALELRPTALDDLGLSAALTAHVRERAAAAGIEADVQISYDAEDVMPEVETACYRIVQEAVHNSILHGRPGRLTVQVVRVQSALTVVIQDDGIGFDDSALRAGAASTRTLGILGMTERAKLLGGDLHVRSAQGHGTTVTATIPLGVA